MFQGANPVEWASYIQKVRAFFDSNGFLEVFTPYVVPVGAFENSLDPLEVRSSRGQEQLHTSPEFEMKRLLSELKRPIYQIAKSFRDDPPTAIHFTEFTMLEFYRSEARYLDTMADTKALFESLAGRKLPFRELTFSRWVEEVGGFRLEDIRDAASLYAKLKELGLSVSADASWEDLLFVFQLERLEPALDPRIPTIVRDYPPALSVLGEKNAKTGWVERFEIYWQGIELCNGCTELADVTELNRRYEIESMLRRAHGKAPHAYPERLAEAMRRMQGAVSSGVAVGLERLWMCLFRQNF